MKKGKKKIQNFVKKKILDVTHLVVNFFTDFNFTCKNMPDKKTDSIGGHGVLMAIRRIHSAFTKETSYTICF